MIYVSNLWARDTCKAKLSRAVKAKGWGFTNRGSGTGSRTRCMFGWQAEPWLMLCDFRRKEQHCSAPAGPRVLHWALVTIHAAIEIRHFELVVKTVGTSGSYWLKNRRVGDSGTQLLIWPGVAYWPIAGCCRLPGLRSQARDEVAWKRRLKLHRRKVLRFWMRPDISSTFQTRCSWIYMDLWYYWIIMMQRNCV